jgi:hypothetical protein
MSAHSAKLAQHYRELAEGEVARAKFALTNEARADHYARAAEHLRLAKAAEELGLQKADVAIVREAGLDEPIRLADGVGKYQRIPIQ